MKTRKFNPLFHLLVLLLAIALNRPHALDFRSLICYAVSMVFPLGIFYACYYWLMPYYLRKRKFLSFTALLLVLLNMVTPIAYFSIIVALDSLSGSAIHLFYRWDMHLSGLSVLSIAALFGIVFQLVARWYRTDGSLRIGRFFSKQE